MSFHRLLSLPPPFEMTLETATDYFNPIPISPLRTDQVTEMVLILLMRIWLKKKSTLRDRLWRLRRMVFIALLRDDHTTKDFFRVKTIHRSSKEGTGDRNSSMLSLSLSHRQDCLRLQSLILKWDSLYRSFLLVLLSTHTPPSLPTIDQMVSNQLSSPDGVRMERTGLRGWSGLAGEGRGVTWREL